jgi:hypothetical protein
LPHDYSTNKRQYRNSNGYISRREVKKAIDRLSKHVTKESARIAKVFEDGGSAAEFNSAMRELLKSAHIVSSSVGRGGRQQMTAADWARVGRKINWQYKYLDRFSRQLERGKFANTVNRARQYVNAVYISYSDSLMTAQKEFIEGGGDSNPKGEMLCYLEQNSEEGCEECTADADAGPMPVSEMGEIGTRICGDFCKCLIIFEDEPEFNA